MGGFSSGGGVLAGSSHRCAVLFLCRPFPSSLSFPPWFQLSAKIHEERRAASVVKPQRFYTVSQTLWAVSRHHGWHALRSIRLYQDTTDGIPLQPIFCAATLECANCLTVRVCELEYCTDSHMPRRQRYSPYVPCSHAHRRVGGCCDARGRRDDFCVQTRSSGADTLSTMKATFEQSLPTFPMSGSDRAVLAPGYRGRRNALHWRLTVAH